MELPRSECSACLGGGAGFLGDRGPLKGRLEPEIKLVQAFHSPGVRDGLTWTLKRGNMRFVHAKVYVVVRAIDDGSAHHTGIGGILDGIRGGLISKLDTR